MLTPDVTQAIRAFLERTQLQGREVAAYTTIMMALAKEDSEYRQFQESLAAAQKKASGAGDVVAPQVADGPN
jgi:hypothetical protein